MLRVSRAGSGRGGGASPPLAQAPTPSSPATFFRSINRAVAPMGPCGCRLGPARGLPCGHNRVAQLMRQAGLAGCHGGGRRTCARRSVIRRRLLLRTWSSGALPHPLQIGSGSLTSRICRPAGRLSLPGGDSGCVQSQSGGLVDAESSTNRTCPGSTGDGRKRAAGSGLIHHSDHGCQYTSVRFGERCAAVGIHPSMGTVGDCFDNAMVESFLRPWRRAAGPAPLPDPRGGTNRGV